MKTIREIQEEFAQAAEEDYEALCKKYGIDRRKGVEKLLNKYRKMHEEWKKEKQRIWQMCEYERKYGHLGLLCGVDEAGRGPLAGPVVAAAVILPENCQILYVNDSKKLTAKKREKLYPAILQEAVAVGVGRVGPERIDEINILQATYEAMREAIGNLQVEPQLLLNDAVTIPQITIPQVPLIHGDARSLSIAAASIVAKVTRDRLMIQYDKEMPQYGFAAHKGYGSAAHIEAIKKYGPSPIHRRSFLKEWTNGK